MSADRNALLDPDRIRSIGFSTAFRGYDQHEVRRFLEQLAEAVRTARAGAARATDAGSAGATAAAGLERTVTELRSTVADLRRELAARDAATVAPAEPVPFDEERAAELLGRETARVLEAARVAAGERTRQAAAEADRVRAEADALRAAAEVDADRIRADADDLRAAAAAEAERVRADAEESAHRSVAEAQETAGRLLAEAEATAGRLVAEAEATAGRLVAEAEATAGRLVAEAEATVGRLRADAEVEVERVHDEADAARQGARRDLEGLASERREVLGRLRAVRARLDDVLSGLDPDDEGDPDRAGRAAEGREAAALDAVAGADPRAVGGGGGSRGAAAEAIQSSAPAGGVGSVAGEPVMLAPIDTAELDDLFARVRAGRDRAVSEARRVLAEDDDAGRGGIGADRSVDGAGPAGRGPAPATAGRSDRDGAMAAPSAGDRIGSAAASDPVAAGWDDALARLQQDALRRLKRALVDAQSELLEAVSRERGPVTVDVLPDPAAEEARYVPAVEPAIRAAVTAGAADRPVPPGDAAPTRGTAGPASQVAAGPASQVAAGLASQVAAAVHAGGVEAIAATGGEPEGVLDEIRAHHRRFRTTELGRLVATALGSAHAASRAAAAEDGAGPEANASGRSPDSDPEPEPEPDSDPDLDPDLGASVEAGGRRGADDRADR